ncbi:MAG TPA: hypothetical protein VIJ94_01525 [Caulobacteraceae bacterium]
MKRFLILAACAGALALPGLANAADVTGAWKVTISVADMTFHAVCNFTQAGGALTGTCMPSDPAPDGAPAPKPSPVTGKVDGSNVAFGYDITFSDMPLHLDYTGTLSSDTAMAGKLSVAGMDGTFTGAKG